MSWLWRNLSILLCTTTAVVQGINNQNQAVLDSSNLQTFEMNKTASPDSDSSAPKSTNWADSPYALYPVPQCDPNGHPAFQMAHLMAGTHNIFIRSINTIHSQAPLVNTPSSKRDLATYASFWIQALLEHHDAEEEFAFPEFERISGGEWKDVGERNREDHRAFNKKLGTFREYVEQAKADAKVYEGQKMVELVENVMDVLHGHLRDEIATIEMLAKYDAVEIENASEKLDEAINQKSGLFTTVPLMVGCHDVTFPGAEHMFPKLASITPYVVHYVFEQAHRKIWRFNPCDSWGKPRPLPYSPPGT